MNKLGNKKSSNPLHPAPPYGATNNQFYILNKQMQQRHHPAVQQTKPPQQNQPHAFPQQQYQQQPPVQSQQVTIQQQSHFNKAQLWQLIEKIGEQFDQVAIQASSGNSDYNSLHPNFQAQHMKLKRLIELRKKCLTAEKCMREKQLALMRERNLYLERCRQIEELGEREEWGGDASGDEGWGENGEYTDDQKLLQELYEILYTEK